MVDRPILRSFIVISKDQMSPRSASVISVAVARTVTNELTAMVVDGDLAISLMRGCRSRDGAYGKATYRSGSNRSAHAGIMHPTELSTVAGKIRARMNYSRGDVHDPGVRRSDDKETGSQDRYRHKASEEVAKLSHLIPPDLQRRSISVEGDIAVFYLNGLWQVYSAIVYPAEADLCTQGGGLTEISIK